MSSCKGKSSWPELVGMDANAAIQTIMRENPRVTVTTVPKGSSVTTDDFRCDRVQVVVDQDRSGTVFLVPKIG